MYNIQRKENLHCICLSLFPPTAFVLTPDMVDRELLPVGRKSQLCRGANRRNRYTENPPNCMGGIREFNCACLIDSPGLTLLLNTSRSFILLHIICLVFYSGDTTRVLLEHAAYRKKPDEGEHETPRYHGV